MTIEYVETVRFLCPVCQIEWTGEKGSPCEDCYGKGWDILMVEACRQEAQKPPLHAPQGRACASDDCPNPVRPRTHGWLCPECYDKQERQRDRDDRLYDAEMERRSEERRGR